MIVTLEEEAKGVGCFVELCCALQQLVSIREQKLEQQLPMVNQRTRRVARGGASGNDERRAC